MQVIAMGGGGFSMEPNNLALDRYVLEQASVQRPKVCFLPTASGDAEGYMVKFYQTFTRLGAQPSHCSLFRLPEQGLEELLLNQDVIYVGGGNTRSMLALWREWNLDQILRQAAQQGTILAGLSAGAICWFEQGVTDSVPGHLAPLDCLGYLPGSCCPHYDGEAGRRPAYQALVSAQEIGPGYGLDDGVALHYVDGSLCRIASSRPSAKAYRVQTGAAGLQEDPLVPDFLG